MERQIMPNDERNDESGRFASKYDDDDFLEAIAELGGAASTSEVTDTVGCPKRTTQHRLSTLRDDGRLTVREVGGAYLWQLVDDHEPTVDESVPDRRESDPAPEPDRSPTDEPEADSEPDRNELRDTLRSTMPGSGDLLEERVDTVLEMYDQLRETPGETVRTGSLKSSVDADRVEYASADSFWSNAVKANSNLDRPNSLTALPGVTEHGNGRYVYQPDE